MGIEKAMKSAAQRHSKIAKALIDGSDETLEISVRATRATNASGASLFADLGNAPSAPTTMGPFNCLWHDATKIVSSSDPRILQLVGKHPNATAIATLKLDDVLVTAGDIYGETLFDVALHVVHRNKKFEVLAIDRHGMANIAPYLVMVVLAGEIRRG